MPTQVVMPALEMAQDTGKLLSWRKQEGETVSKGEILLEIETDKAVVEIEAAADGVLAGVKAAPGDVIPVGQTIAWILGKGESVPMEEAPVRSPGGDLPNRASSSPSRDRSPLPARTGASRVKISPKARRVAQERGIDIGSLRGSGAEGEILVSDVLAARPGAAARPPAPVERATLFASAEAQARRPTLGPVARLMAERTTQSWTTIPHFFLTREIEATALKETKQSLARSQGVKLTHTDLLILVVAQALEQSPYLNASWIEGAIEFHHEVNIGLAMAVEEGVVTGVVRNANKIGLAEIALERRGLAERARAGRLRPNDITGATFTISNLGMYQVNAFTAIIVPPQAAILAVGEIADRVLAVDGKPTVRPTVTLTLCCDHRVIDGARAARFMQILSSALQSGASPNPPQPPLD